MPTTLLCKTNPTCRGLASGETGASLAPLHLSRTLYKPTLFMQNKPNFQKAQMNVSNIITRNYKNFIPLAGQKNKPNSNPNKPNLQKAKMNVNSLITKGYRKKDDFAVQKNKPNSNPIQTQTNPISNPTTAKKAPINLGRAKDDGGQIEYKHEIRSTKFETNSKRDCFVTSPSATPSTEFTLN